MPVNLALGHVSNGFLITALVIYSLSVVAVSGDFAFGRPRRAAATARVRQAQDRAAALASVGAAGRTAAAPAVPGTPAVPGAPVVPGAAADGVDDGSGRAGSMPELEVPALDAIRQAGPWVRTAVALSLAGVAAHTTAVITRGLAVHRAPWGNMYEFVTALTCVAAIFFLFVMIRYRAWALGVFVMGAVVVALGLASIEQLDRLTYRTIVFGFPVWTFGVIAGAIWADQAWGRYWGWDPVETWAFITWVFYATFLHARATAGWRGRRAHYIQLLGFASLMFNILVVQVFIAGL